MVNELISKDEDIIIELNKNFIPVILYVDDRSPTSEPLKAKLRNKGKPVKTMGNIWANIEISRFYSNMQPFVVLINAQEEELRLPLTGRIEKKMILDYLKI